MLARKYDPDSAFECGGQNAYFSQLSPRLGDGGGRLFGSKRKRDPADGVKAALSGVLGVVGVGVVGTGENSADTSSIGASQNNDFM